MGSSNRFGILTASWLKTHIGSPQLLGSPPPASIPNGFMHGRRGAPFFFFRTWILTASWLPSSPGSLIKELNWVPSFLAVFGSPHLLGFLAPLGSPHPLPPLPTQKKNIVPIPSSLSSHGASSVAHSTPMKPAPTTSTVDFFRFRSCRPQGRRVGGVELWS